MLIWRSQAWLDTKKVVRMDHIYRWVCKTHPFMSFFKFLASWSSVIFWRSKLSQTCKRAGVSERPSPRCLPTLAVSRFAPAWCASILWWIMSSLASSRQVLFAVTIISWMRWYTQITWFHDHISGCHHCRIFCFLKLCRDETPLVTEGKFLGDYFFLLRSLFFLLIIQLVQLFPFHALLFHQCILHLFLAYTALKLNLKVFIKE